MKKPMREPFRHHLLAGAVVLILPPSCNSGYSPPQVQPQPTNQSAEAHASMVRGRSIHQAKCANCHAFEDPSKYSEGVLKNDILPRMSRLAKLTDNEQDAVRAYLLSVSKR